VHINKLYTNRFSQIQCIANNPVLNVVSKAAKNDAVYILCSNACNQKKLLFYYLKVNQCKRLTFVHCS